MRIHHVMVTVLFGLSICYSPVLAGNVAGYVRPKGLAVKMVRLKTRHVVAACRHQVTYRPIKIEKRNHRRHSHDRKRRYERIPYRYSSDSGFSGIRMYKEQPVSTSYHRLKKPVYYSRSCR